MKNSRSIIVLLLISLAANIFFFYDKCEGTEQVMLTEGLKEHLISYQEAQNLENEYVRGRYRIINDSLFKDSQRKDTRYFWFSMKTMQEYLDYVKGEAKTKGYTDLGLRIYFAAYPKNFSDSRGDPGFSTVFIQPTKEELGQRAQQANFFPLPPPPPVPVDDIDGLNYGGGGP